MLLSYGSCSEATATAAAAWKEPIERGLGLPMLTLLLLLLLRGELVGRARSRRLRVAAGLRRKGYAGVSRRPLIPPVHDTPTRTSAGAPSQAHQVTERGRMHCACTLSSRCVLEQVDVTWLLVSDTGPCTRAACYATAMTSHLQNSETNALPPASMQSTM
jgi:hypothetical protein